MSETIKITATVAAWLPEWHTADQLLAAADNEKMHSRVVGSMLTYSIHEHKDWTRVGEAEITVTLMPRDECVSVAVKSLQAQLEKERADSQVRQNAILDRIGKLTALTYEAA